MQTYILCGQTKNMSPETFRIVLSVNSSICYLSWTVESDVFANIFMNLTIKNARLTSRIEIESCSQWTSEALWLYDCNWRAAFQGKEVLDIWQVNWIGFSTPQSKSEKAGRFNGFSNVINHSQPNKTNKHNCRKGVVGISLCCRTFFRHLSFLFGIKLTFLFPPRMPLS